MSAAFTLLTPAGAQPHKQGLLLCGKEKVFEATIDSGAGEHPALRTVWTWSAADSEGLPAQLAPKFRTTDDCKPVSNGREILISSSGGAIALVSRPSGKTLFYASVTNAHSVELLPGGLIAAASSTSPTGTGEKIVLFRREEPDKPIASLPLPSAHGVQWDARRHCLWALGFDRLLSIAVDDTPSLKTIRSFHLPSTGGHDLQMTQNGSLLVTTTTQVLECNPESGSFSDFAPLAGEKEIKSLSINEETKQLAYTQADHGEWWTYTLRFKNPAATISLPDFIYKVRWAATRA